MPSQKNKDLLKEAQDRVGRSTAIFFADYQKVTHKDLETLRGKLKSVDGELAVSKNRLINIALKEKGVEAAESLQGPLGAFFAYGDPVVVAKAIYDFFKPIDVKKIKFGIFDGKFVDEKTVLALASLPPREMLLTKLVGLLVSPMRGLVYNLNWTALQFVRTLKAVEEKKSANS